MRRDSFVKEVKIGIKKILYKHFDLYKDKYLGIHLQGGLCNKLHGLMSACDIAVQENCRLIEPYFGWKEKILFSDIYDLEYFNSQMHDSTGVKDMIISRVDYDSANLKKKSIENVVPLWEHSEKELNRQRQLCLIKRDHMKLKVLRALRLNDYLAKMVDSYTNGSTYSAVQVRTESDWKKYTKDFNGLNNERIYVPVEDIIEMVRNFETDGSIFFTSGENQEEIKKQFEDSGLETNYFYNSKWEYEVNAAINFEICSRANKFIGLSRSSYSNMICLKRAAILNKDRSFIYNFGNKIQQRKDMGIQYKGELSITNKTLLV